MEYMDGNSHERHKVSRNLESAIVMHVNLSHANMLRNQILFLTFPLHK